MLLRTPRDLHYPITIRELLKQNQDYVKIADHLFSYTYTTEVTEVDSFGEQTTVRKEFTTRYESSIEGDLVHWRIQPGAVINTQGHALCEVKEACTHDVQYGGMCANCGKDLTVITYNTTPLADKRQSMRTLPHVRDAALTVSQDELARTENEAKRRLLQTRKLSLVVDLDQTVIHATVDPTVAEWQQDESNPNHEAVKEVAAFQLRDDNGQWVWYYIKRRPGLVQFFEEISKLFQLHIYTMGTRSYAENIAKIIDPHSTLFGDRILSRTDIPENQKHKSLQDLFPVDTKMVVIIDDRADVWNYSDYLVKVIPYEFFVGIGDINSAFLAPALRAPTKEILPAPANGVDTASGNTTDAGKPPADGTVQPGGLTSSEDETTNGASPLSQIMSLNDGNDAAALESKTEEQKETLAAQVSERPLLQRQKIQDKVDEEAEGLAVASVDEMVIGDQPIEIQRQRHSILRDDDVELQHLTKTLQEIHERFFKAYDQARLMDAPAGRVAQLKGVRPVKRKTGDELVPDVKDIISNMKREISVLSGTVLVFSKIAPQAVDVRHTLTGRLAMAYGATINNSMSKATTHLVTVPTEGPDPRKGEPAKITLPSTSKVNAAARLPDTKVILEPYILDSSVSFRRLNEAPYQIHLQGKMPTFEEGEIPETAPESVKDSQALASDTTKLMELEGPSDSSLDSKTEPTSTSTSPPTTAAEDEFWAEDHSDLLALSKEDLEELSDEDLDSFSDTSDEDSDGDSSMSGSESNSPKKRKRLSSRASAEASGEVDGSRATAEPGSELQQRKRRALQRSSSLTNVTSSSALNAPPSSTGKASALQNDTDDDLAADEDALAAELAGDSDDDNDDDEDSAL